MIHETDTGYECDDPCVKRVELEFKDKTSPPIYTLRLFMADGSQKDFGGKPFSFTDKLIKEAEEWLSQLSIIYYHKFDKPIEWSHEINGKTFTGTSAGEWRCTDARVDKVAYNGASAADPNSLISLFLNIILKDGTSWSEGIKDPEADAFAILAKKAEAWLATL